MKSQDILAGMIREFGLPVGLYSKRDELTVISRIQAEGPEFAEIALPQLDDALLKGLSTGQLPVITGWSTKRHEIVPLFLRGHWLAIFTVTGELLSTPSVHSIRAIRQISRSYKKIFEVCSDERVAKSINDWLKVDQSLVGTVPSWGDTLSEVTQYLFGEVVGRAISSKMGFRHGPGGVAERLDSVARYGFQFISEEVAELVGPETFRATWESLHNDPPVYRSIPARLTAVPKTGVKPRLITIEPSYNQFLQQGLATELRRLMSRYPVCNILDQSRNNRLAQSSSIDGSMATIDLSDASDRISTDLVRSMFAWNPAFVQFITATRSEVVELPSGDLVHLNKFAGMGSALTFPVETMVFTAIAVYAACKEDGNFSRAKVRSYLTREDFGIYGDDIICPTSVGPSVIHHLEEVGLTVSHGKSFLSGGFRESCGGDYFRGHDVTPVYFRRNLPTSRRDVKEIVALSSSRNQWVRKYWYGEVSDLLDQKLSSLIQYPALSSSVDDPKGLLKEYGGVGRVGLLDVPIGEWNTDLQRREVKCHVLHNTRKLVKGTDHDKLFKALYEGFSLDPLHLSHHGRATSAKLKRSWVSVA